MLLTDTKCKKLKLKKLTYAVTKNALLGVRMRIFDVNNDIPLAARLKCCGCYDAPYQPCF